MEKDDSFESGDSVEGSLIGEKNLHTGDLSNGCFYTFSSEVFKLSIISYYFWIGFCYIIGSITLVSGYHSSSLRIQDQIVCAGSSNVYVFCSLWFLIGIICIITCIGYTVTIDEENNKIYDQNSAIFIHILGILCKTIPTIIRIIHIFNLFQLYLLTIDIMFLPECNSFPVRFILFIIHILWWFIVFFGIISRKKIFLPPHLYKPITNDAGFVAYINNLLHSFGL
ncbi:conserved Plasmodium membrane protein, unknown function [Plasmodium reichenowi]|uniref:Putative membrane protein n=1 Tax=Plasmodium reichenowi TaxID=5854 RepID=A0A060RSB9_PLARE|nr:putative membrane protein [Plasmodium reichenowi]KYN98577.1 putative membrane protein [Plasmodium reichenowi]CDO64343.1 conserved Plasmodium membrane protein, unknown function [Plasmodium reichenowi]